MVLGMVLGMDPGIGPVPEPDVDPGTGLDADPAAAALLVTSGISSSLRDPAGRTRSAHDAR